MTSPVVIGTSSAIVTTTHAQVQKSRPIQPPSKDGTQVPLAVKMPMLQVPHAPLLHGGVVPKHAGDAAAMVAEVPTVATSKLLTE